MRVASKQELTDRLADLEQRRKDILDGKRDQETEVYSRIVGYYRAIKNWNKGRAQEFEDRKEYKI